MKRGRLGRKPGQKKAGQKTTRDWHPPKIGKVLLELSDALRKAERCRRTLARYGLSRRRWQEIVKDIDPDLRFMVRPQLMDEVATYLEDAAGPVDLDLVVNELHARGVGSAERIRQVIRLSINNGRLEQHPENRIGLPGRVGRG